MTLEWVFRTFTIGVAVALGALLIDVQELDEPWRWAGVLPWALWIVGPAVAPYAIAARRRRTWFSIAMFLYLVASSLFSGFIYLDAFFRSRSSTASLVMVFVPLYQWMALALLLFLCSGIAVWRRRRGKLA